MVWERIQKNGFMVVGVDPSIPPFGIWTEGEPAGIDPAIAKEIGDRLGVQIYFAPLTFDGAYDSLLLADTDMVIAAIRPDTSRAYAISYSMPYFDAGQVLVGRDGFENLDELRDKTLAVEFASEGDLIVRDFEEISLQRYFTPDEALDAILNGDSDAALVDSVSVRIYIAENDVETLHIADEKITNDPYVIAVRRGDWRLLQAVNEQLQVMQEDGTLHQIMDDWFTP